MPSANHGSSGSLDRQTALLSLLNWEGQISRGRLMELFNMSPTRASEWIREFREVHPEWTTWNGRARCFEATATAYRADSENTRGQSLAHYLTTVGGFKDSKTSPVTVRAYRDFVAPKPRIYATLHKAISARLRVDLTYRSMRQPAPHEQCIEPHALVLAGPRWHVRAFSITRNEYRDFALGRIVGCELTETPASHRSEADVAWTTSVKVRLIAHPQLSAAQEDMVRHEYFDGAVERVEVMRGALIPYLLHELRVAYEPTKQRPPDYFLAVRNVKDVARWVFPT